MPFDLVVENSEGSPSDDVFVLPREPLNTKNTTEELSTPFFQCFLRALSGSNLDSDDVISRIKDDFLGDSEHVYDTANWYSKFNGFRLDVELSFGVNPLPESNGKIAFFSKTIMVRCECSFSYIDDSDGGNDKVDEVRSAGGLTFDIEIDLLSKLTADAKYLLKKGNYCTEYLNEFCILLDRGRQEDGTYLFSYWTGVTDHTSNQIIPLSRKAAIAAVATKLLETRKVTNPHAGFVENLIEACGVYVCILVGFSDSSISGYFEYEAYNIALREINRGAPRDPSPQTEFEEAAPAEPSARAPGTSYGSDGAETKKEFEEAAQPDAGESAWRRSIGRAEGKSYQQIKLMVHEDLVPVLKQVGRGNRNAWIESAIIEKLEREGVDPPVQSQKPKTFKK